MCLKTDAMISSDMDRENLCMLVGETFGLAVIDTGCPKTVSGNDWMTTYIESLSSKDRASIRYNRSSNTFRFGDGQIYKSKKRLTVPIYISDQKHHLYVDIVDCCIPLLISRDTLKRANAHIDIGNNSMQFLGLKVPLITSSTGHLCLSISRIFNANNVETKRVFNTLFSSPFYEFENDSDLNKKVSKLHSQFAHPNSERLVQLVKNSGIDNAKVFETIKKVTANCDVCRRFKQRPLKPAVGFPLASQFNETVALDLKQIDPNLYILHMVDHLSRYSSACLIYDKKK